MKYLIVAISIILISCQSLNDKTVKDMPSAYLCKLVSDDYITLPSEQQAVYRELEKREHECASTHKVIIENR